MSDDKKPHSPIPKRYFGVYSRSKLGKSVLCTLGEYKRYKEYLRNVDMSWEKCFHQELRGLLKEFMVLKLAGEIPENTTCPDMRDWIMERGEKAFRSMLEETLDPICNLNVAWEVSHRDALEKLEQEIIEELQLEQQHQLKSKNEIPNQSSDLVEEDLDSCFIISAWSGPSDPIYSSKISKECIIVPSKEAESVEFASEVEKTSASTKTKNKKGAWAVLRRAWKALKRTFSCTGRTKISPVFTNIPPAD
ncbi:uncharacterized protein LOC134309144 isoform X2 [Trichomycterus rosablanca]|uniref:uncharacterized protein LOC134309144 isoform X2 n=1 Tax=Trichomycterus rosablanca TaxID=2290929 RepID=UPI002F34F33C